MARKRSYSKSFHFPKFQSQNILPFCPFFNNMGLADHFGTMQQLIPEKAIWIQKYEGWIYIRGAVWHMILLAMFKTTLLVLIRQPVNQWAIWRFISCSYVFIALCVHRNRLLASAAVQETLPSSQQKFFFGGGGGQELTPIPGDSWDLLVSHPGIFSTYHTSWDTVHLGLIRFTFSTSLPKLSSGSSEKRK